METKFTKGKWKTIIADCSDYLLCAVISESEDSVICHTTVDNKMSKEEQKANAKLISLAPEMFYRTVLLANSEGWQDAFDLICKITGKEYKYLSDDFNQLVEEARSFFKH